MPSILNELETKFRNALSLAFPDHPTASFPIEVAQSTQDKFGHYQFNSAMKLTKTLNKNPRVIAEAIINQLQGSDEKTMISKLEIAGPGFINISLAPEYLSQRLAAILDSPRLGIELPVKVQKIIIDFSSPNTAKEMHVGHLRSTIIGDSLARLFEFKGHEVLRLNHIGDWGTAFGMLIAYLKKVEPGVITGETPTDLTHLVQWYKTSKKMFDEDADFKKQSQLEVVKLQGGDPTSLKAWKIICDISEKAYQEIYDLLGIRLISRGESFYNPVLPETIRELESKGLITISDGAKCLFLDGFLNREGLPLPLMLQKSDGGYNYDTTDMATIRQRIRDEKGDRLIYVTDAGQSTHFQMIFKAAEKAGYLDPKKVQVDHVPFGVVLGSDGKKFRTRSGETERLIDLIENAIKQSYRILEERSPEMPESEKRSLAKALGIGAIKYADLSSHRVSDYTFSYERMLRFEGNTAAFLMYSYVRINGIKRKVQADLAKIQETTKIHLVHPSEIALALQINQFGEVLNQVAVDLLPHRLADYLYHLADKFNAFFRDCRVEGTEEQNSRLLLCEATARTLKTGLHILGVETVERM